PGSLNLLPPPARVLCPIAAGGRRLRDPGGLGGRLTDAGCPMGPVVHDRERFETLLAELFATFFNLPGDEVDAQITAALARIVDFLGVDRGGYGELSADGERLVVTHSFNRPGAPPMPSLVLDTDLPWYAALIRAGGILRLSNLPDDLPMKMDAERRHGKRQGNSSHVMIPMRVRDSICGVLGFGDFHVAREWPEGLVQRLRIVGEVFASALARKRADEAIEARETTIRRNRDMLRTLAAKLLGVQEEERRRIAREMHDDWSQRLAVLGIELTKLEGRLGDRESAMAILRNVREEMVRLSGDVHDLSRQLHPSILNDLGLAEALRSEAEHFQRREGISVDFHAGEVPQDLSDEVRICAYRVAQEALRNVGKHANARAVSVRLERRDEGLFLEVSDDGEGFDAAAGRCKEGLGLSSMSERLRLVGALLEVDSEPGRGARVSACIPLSAAPA
ncbi:MAG TPA: GAF domain-containing sensor histidine kinase, partial [Planctomycetia bacterium]|nr:GAF domain-containing sensor histidine kinase [Planctomycetia bacterium]